MYEGADDSIPMDSMESMEACCSLENCCVDSDDLAKLAATANTSTEEDEEEDVQPSLEVHHQHEESHGTSQDTQETPCCYDLDASLDSTDVQLSSSHEDHAIESQLRIRRRQHEEQRQQLNQDCRRVVSETGKAAFIPFSEETMFCDSNDMAPPMHTGTGQVDATDAGSVDTSSPVSSDSWMNYSSHSSDDYSFMLEQGRGGSVGGGSVGDGAEMSHRHQVRRHRSEDVSMESGASIVPKNKRNRDSFKFRKGEASIDEGDAVVQSEVTGAEGDTSSCDRDEEEEDDDDDEGDHESVDETLAHLQINQPKRLRGKEPTTVTGSNNSTSAGVGGAGRKSVSSSRRSSTNSQQLVDIRIIDFAHTAFVKRSSSAQMMPPPVPGKTEGAAATTTAVHKGPDCGFLTGVDSLKRLLQEILPTEGDTSNSNVSMVE